MFVAPGRLRAVGVALFAQLAADKHLRGLDKPDFVDGLVPLACAPTQIAGRNRMFRRLAMDAIKSDPAWPGDGRSQEFQTKKATPEGKGARSAFGGSSGTRDAQERGHSICRPH